jgi:hypothetical protein
MEVKMRSGLYFISAVVFCMACPAFGALNLTADGEDVEYLDLMTYQHEALIGIVTDGADPDGFNQVYLSITGNSEVGLWTGYYEIFAYEYPLFEPCERVDENTWCVTWDDPFGNPGPYQIGEFGYMSWGYAEYDVHVTLFDSDMNQLDRISISQTPEPGTCLLLAVGGAAIALKRRKR